MQEVSYKYAVCHTTCIITLCVNYHSSIVSVLAILSDMMNY